jgi:Sister chromatid cohesion protein Dcc1
MTRVETSNTVLLLPAAMDHSCQTANSTDDATEKSHRYANLARRPLRHQCAAMHCTHCILCYLLPHGTCIRTCCKQALYVHYIHILFASHSNSSTTFEICATSGYQFELTKSHPDLENIRVLLAKNPYRGQDAEDPLRTVYTLQQLEVSCQILRLTAFACKHIMRCLSRM